MQISQPSLINKLLLENNSKGNILLLEVMMDGITYTPVIPANFTHVDKFSIKQVSDITS